MSVESVRSFKQKIAGVLSRFSAPRSLQRTAVCRLPTPQGLPFQRMLLPGKKTYAKARPGSFLDPLVTGVVEMRAVGVVLRSDGDRRKCRPARS